MIPVVRGTTRRNFGLKQVDHLSLLIEPWWLIGQPKNQRWTSALWLVSGMTSSPWGLIFERIRSNPCSMKTSKRMCHPSSLRCWGQSCYAVVLSLPSPGHQWTLCGNRSNCSTRRRRGNPILMKSLGIAGASESSRPRAGKAEDQKGICFYRASILNYIRWPCIACKKIQWLNLIIEWDISPCTCFQHFAYGRVSKWGDLFSPENSHFGTKKGHLILRHTHIFALRLELLRLCFFFTAWSP